MAFLRSAAKSPSAQLCLELLKRNLQGAGAFWFQIFGRKLQLAASLVNRRPSAQYHLHAIFWPETQQSRLRTEHYGANLRLFVF
jgi:hypothetical protein